MNTSDKTGAGSAGRPTRHDTVDDQAVCVKAPEMAEHQRLGDDDLPCDDGRSGNLEKHERSEPMKTDQPQAETTECPECRGTGKISAQNCSSCGATGQIIVHSHSHGHGDTQHEHPHSHAEPHRPDDETTHEHNH